MPAGIIVLFVGTLAIEIVAIAKRWDGLAREISFLVAFPALPLAIRTAFPHTGRHIRTALTVLGCGCALVAAVFLVRLGWLSREEPVIKIGVSLPFRNDEADAGPMYNGIQHAMDDMAGAGIRHIGNHALEMNHHRVELAPFDDSAIGDSDCRGGHTCPIADMNGGRRRDFTDVTRDPQVVGIIGPFNSGVAVREIPAVRAAHTPLLGPTNTADCLTNPRLPDGDCDVGRLGLGTYFRLATPDRWRQKVMADYLWSTWQDQHPTGSPPRVVIYEESGPRGETFSRGAGARFTEAWLQHPSASAPDVYPLANASTDRDLQNALKNLTYRPDIIVYAGTGDGGPRLYQAIASVGWSNTIFAGPGSLENAQFATDINNASGGTLYAVDFAAISDSKNPAVQALQQPKIYSALAYDATMICLHAVQRTLQEQGGVLDTFGFRTRLALAAKPLDIGAEYSFRERVIGRITWLNTSTDRGIEYRGLTGTYSFDDNDADGAAGVTISTYDRRGHEWKPVKAGTS